MRIPKKLMLAGLRVGSYLAYGTTAEANWIYEKVQRPESCLILAMNLLYWKLHKPRICGVVSLLLEPAFDCNLRCRYCPWTLVPARLEGLRPRLMDWDIFRKAVDEAPASIESIQLAGLGEPTLHPRLCEMIDYIADHGKRVVLFSNCTLLRGDLLEQLARTRLSVLTVSGEPDEETCRQNRGIDLKTILRNVEQFVLRKRPETEVKLRLVATSDNVCRIDSLRESWGDIFQDVKICPAFQLEGDGRAFSCMEPWRGNINVYTNGKVTPCCLDGFEDLIIGNVLEQSLSDILRGDNFRKLLACFTEGRAPKRCASCSDVKLEGLPSLIPRSASKSK